MDSGLMIIELRNYNSAKELLIGPQSAGSPGQVYNWSMERGVSVTRAAVHMKGTEDGTRGKIQGCIQPASDSGMRVDADVKDWVSVQTSIHLISISLSSLPLLFLIHASICCCQSLTYYYLLQKCDSVTSALLPETEV